MTRLPTSSASIEPRWLNEVLPDQVRGGAQVTGVDATVIGEGVGFLGEVARLTLTYDEPSESSARSVISKMPTENEGFKAIGSMLGLYNKESGFYRDAAPHMQIRIPACHANLHDDAGNFLLLLEDLAPMRPGNQLASCSLDEARMALDEVAKIHANWWESDRLDTFEAWLPSAGSPTFDVFEAGYLGSVPAFLEHWRHLVSDEVCDLVERIAANYHDMIDHGPGRSPNTLIHGDFRLDNMMFDDADDQAGLALLDFQLPFRANPMWDVVYFLAGNFSPEWRREHQDDLVAGYHRALVDRGVTGYSLDQCFEDYRATGLVLTGYLVTGAADIDLETLNDRGAELIETMFTRYGNAIDDLGSAAFMPDSSAAGA